MSPLNRPTVRRPYLLFLEDQGTRVTAPDGQELGFIQTAPPEGLGSKTPWVDELRRLLPKGAPVQICVGLSKLGVHCQETPAMPPKEARQVALRVVASEQPGEVMLVGNAMDPDGQARGGHIHWTAFLPATDLNNWAAALEAAGMKWVHAAAWPRTLWRALPVVPETPRDRMVLVLAPFLGRLLFFRGPALVLQRNFRLSLDPTEEGGLEQCAEETARTLQFYKQKFRGSAPGDLLLLGATRLPTPLEARFRGMGLAAHCLQEPLEALLLRGLALERTAQGLDLRPPHVQEAQRRRALQAALVLATAGLLAAFSLGGGLLRARERMLDAEAAQVERELTRRQALDRERSRVVAARVPLLRLRAAEARQARATERIGRLAATLFSAPESVELETVEIQQLPGEEGHLAFQVTGTAFTQKTFSVGPLASYLARLQRLPGLTLDPAKEVSVSDRLLAADSNLQSRALTRFTLSGRHR